MRRFPGAAALFSLVLGVWVQALPSQAPAHVVVGAIRTRTGEPGGIWVLRAKDGAWRRQVVGGTQQFVHNPASLALDPRDPEVLYVGTYGRSETGEIGPCHVQRLRIVDGHVEERLQLNADPLEEDYLLAVVPLGDSIYYLGRHSIGRVPRTGGAVTTLSTHPAWLDARGMATDGRHLFVIISGRDILRADLPNLSTITLLARSPQNTKGEELRNLAVDREGHVMAITISPAGNSHLYRFHGTTGKVLNTVPLPMAGARAVVQDPETGDVFVSGGVLVRRGTYVDGDVSEEHSVVVRLSGWQVQEPLVAAVPHALPALLVGQGRSFFPHGTGCPDKSGRAPLTTRVSPLVGGRSMAWVSGPSNQPVALLVGRHVDQADTRLPIDLAILGAPGCALDLTHFAAVSGRTDVRGVASLGFVVPPNQTALPFWVRVQWIAMAPGANLAGLVVSPSATVLFRSQ